LTNGTPIANVVPPEAQEEASDEERGERVGDVAEVEHRDDGQGGDRGEHPPRAEPVGEGADRDPPKRPDDHRDRHQQRLLERGQRQLLAQRRAQRREQRPGPEGHREPTVARASI
jgi:hypothetical protein